MDIDDKEECALLHSTLDSAFITIISEKPTLLSGNSGSKDAYLISCHVMQIAKTYRALAREDRTPRSVVGRRYPKTYCLRRKFSAADWAFVRPIMNQIKIDTPTADVATHCHALRSNCC